MQPPVEAKRLISLCIPALPDRLCLVRALVKRAAESVGCSTELCNQLVIAVNEACMNVIQHAYRGHGAGEITLEILNNDSQLFFRLEDDASPVDLDTVRPRDLDDIRPGGLGVHFIREIMDECEMGHRSGGAGNYLEMTKRIS
jgi:anti-sigma regulatory factor (Ser/Thr protein kinase)